jgi:hypothetical protein
MSETRSNGKPNTARRNAIRESLKGWCGTCALDLDWSSECPDKAPGKGTFGHIVAEEVGGTWALGNIIAQCWACNWSAKCAGLTDLTAYVIPEAIPRAYLPTKAVQSDRRDVPASATVNHNRAERRAARVNVGGWR